MLSPSILYHLVFSRNQFALETCQLRSPGGWPLGVAKHQPSFRFRRPRAGGHACSRHLGSCLACEWSRWRRVPIKRPKENDIFVIMCIGSVRSNAQMNLNFITIYHKVSYIYIYIHNQAGRFSCHPTACTFVCTSIHSSYSKIAVRCRCTRKEPTSSHSRWNMIIYQMHLMPNHC